VNTSIAESAAFDAGRASERAAIVDFIRGSASRMSLLAADVAVSLALCIEGGDLSVPARQLQQAPCDLDPPSNFGAGWTDGEHETFIEVRGYIAELCDFQPEQQMWRLIGWLDGRIGDNRP